MLTSQSLCWFSREESLLSDREFSATLRRHRGISRYFKAPYRAFLTETYLPALGLVLVTVVVEILKRGFLSQPLDKSQGELEMRILPGRDGRQ